jgi:hypothetical protein
MKTKIFTCAVAGILITSAPARNVVSPDKQFALKAEAALTIVDSSGQPVLTLVKDTAGDSKVEVQWSPDSKRIVVVETSGRGSDIVAAWRDGNVWHRTIELDADQSNMLMQAQNRFGRLVAEHRTLGSWVSQNAIKVNGVMIFGGGLKRSFTYILEFGHGPIHLSRGGYEDGAIVGRDFQLL